MVQAIVADYNASSCALIRENLEEAGIRVVAVVHDGLSAIREIRAHRPDFVVMDIILPHIDGLGVMETIRGEDAFRTRFFVLTKMNTPDVIASLNRMEISGFFLKPYDFELLARRILAIICPGQTQPVVSAGRGNLGLARETAHWLHWVAVPPHVKGYAYLMTAIPMVVEEPELISAMTTVLYPRIAEKHHTTASCVERNMRQAIMMAWNRCRVEVMEQVFGNTLDVNKDKPNNSEFIAMLADHIRLGEMI